MLHIIFCLLCKSGFATKSEKQLIPLQTSRISEHGQILNLNTHPDPNIASDPCFGVGISILSLKNQTV